MNGQQLSKAAARRMWLSLQQHYGQGGFLLFNGQGNGGYWYADNAHPDMGSTDIPVACLDSECQLLTLEQFTEDTQRWLDQRTEDRAREVIDVAALVDDNSKGEA
jgi:hypothetical protein